MALGQIPQGGGDHFPAQQDVRNEADHKGQPAESPDANMVQKQTGGEENGTEDERFGRISIVVVVVMVLLVDMLMVVVTAVALMVVFVMFVVIVTAVALVVVFVMFVVVVTAVALVVVFMMVMVVMTAVALMVVMVMVIMAAAAVLAVFVVMLMRMGTAGTDGGGIPGIDDGTMLDGTGDFGQFRNQCIGIFGGDPQLPGGEGDGGLLHLGMRVDLCFNLGCAVSAIQILYDIDLSCHEVASLDESTYEQTFI